MATLASQLVVSLLDRVTRPARVVNQSLTKMRLQVDANARAMDAMRGRMLDAAGMGYVLVKAISAPVNAAREFEAVMADINKVVDFAAPDGLAKMSADILALSREIPVAATGIGEIVAAAGQAGMQGDELLAFAEMAAKVGVAFDISADQVGESLAKIKTALGLSVDQTSELADVINHLSNTSASAAPDLLDFMRRVGSAGVQMGFSAREVAGIGSAMVAAGAQADVAATSFRNMAKALARGDSATKRQRQAYKVLGLSATDVAKRLQQDAVGTMNDVIGRIRELPKEVQAATISDLFGDEARAIMPLIENAKLLEQALSSVADETNYLGSANQEFQVRAETFDARLQSFKNRMNELAIVIGNALLPALTRAMDTIMPMISAVADLAAQYPQVTTAVVGLLGSLVALKTAVIASRFAFLFLKGGALSAALGVSQAAGLIVAATKRLRLAVLGASMLGAVGGGGLFTMLAASAGAAVAGVKAAAAGIGAALLGITWPIALVIAAVAGLSLAVYRYWEPISGFVAGFAEAISEGLSAALSAVTGFSAELAAAVGTWAADRIVDVGALLGIDETMIRAELDRLVSAVSGTLAAIAATVLAVPSTVAGWISDIFSMKDYSTEAEAGFREAGRKAGKALIDAIIEAFGQLWAYLKTLPDKILAAIGKIDLSGIFTGLNPFSSGSGSAASAIDGARAAGGPIAGGRTYLTGEYGPELITPTKSGYVHDAKSTRAMLSGGALQQPASVTVSIGDIVVQGAVNAREIAEQIGDEIRSELAGLQADRSWSVA
ncbi:MULTISPECIES: phage tail tape measure protein [unclassified Roseibium]|uniref:phage tail tape measure protein n=1 Tax=unclassified Roseibium TaxID=2629323 RepID=UPI00273FA7B7|nr:MULTISPECIES: phage tail tape measure protein [unclassified Roseibium]